MKKLNIAIFGIGAVGQCLGYILNNAGHTITFLNRVGDPIKKILGKSYITIDMVMVKDKGKTTKQVILDIHNLNKKNDLYSFDIIFISVGYANISLVAQVLEKKFYGMKKLPKIVFLENYYEPEKLFLTTLPRYPKTKLIFGIPDIISYRPNKSYTRVLYPFTFMLGDNLLIKLIADVHFEYAKDVKTKFLQRLCSHNTAHNMLAYIGHAKRYVTINEAIADDDLREKMIQALEEGAHGLVNEYGVSLDQQKIKIMKEVDKLYVANFDDPIKRVARTPIKKLGQYERFILPALLAYKAGVFPYALCEGIAHLLLYNDPGDREAELLKSKLKSEQIEQVLKEFSGLDIGHPITQHVKKLYLDLSSSKG